MRNGAYGVLSGGRGRYRVRARTRIAWIAIGEMGVVHCRNTAEAVTRLRHEYGGSESPYTRLLSVGRDVKEL